MKYVRVTKYNVLSVSHIRYERFVATYVSGLIKATEQTLDVDASSCTVTRNTCTHRLGRLGGFACRFDIGSGRVRYITKVL